MSGAAVAAKAAVAVAVAAKAAVAVNAALSGSDAPWGQLRHWELHGDVGVRKRKTSVASAAVAGGSMAG